MLTPESGRDADGQDVHLHGVLGCGTTRLEGCGRGSEGKREIVGRDMEGSGDESDWLAVVLNGVMEGWGGGEGNGDEAETGGMKEKLLVE